nr:hypothetical protein [Candidatus Sigynarchaeota archaeon]
MQHDEDWLGCEASRQGLKLAVIMPRKSYVIQDIKLFFALSVFIVMTPSIILFAAGKGPAIELAIVPPFMLGIIGALFLTTYEDAKKTSWCRVLDFDVPTRRLTIKLFLLPSYSEVYEYRFSRTPRFEARFDQLSLIPLSKASEKESNRLWYTRFYY